MISNPSDENALKTAEGSTFSPWARVLLIGLLWSVVCLLPPAIVRSRFWGRANNPLLGVIGELGVIGCCLLEGAVMILLASLVKTVMTTPSPMVKRSAYRRGLALLNRILAAFILSLPVFVLVFSVFSSITLYLGHRIFLQSNHLLSISAGSHEFFAWVPFADWRTLLLLGVLTVLWSFLLYLLAPKSTATLIPGLTWLWGMAVMIVVGAFLLYPRLALSQAERTHFEKLGRSALAPNITLLWRSFFFPEPEIPRYTGPCLSPTHSGTASASGSGQSIVLVVIEAFRSDAFLHPGSEKIFPALTRLAADGMSFSRAYSASNESSYGNVSILTGAFPLKLPWRDSFTDARTRRPLIYEILADHGYRTSLYAPHNEAWQNVDQVLRSQKLGLLFEAPRAAAPELFRYASHVLGERTTEAARKARSNFLDAALVGRFQEWLSEGSPQAPFFAKFFFNSSHFPYESVLPEFRLFEPSELLREDLQYLSFLGYPRRYTERLRHRHANNLHFADFLLAHIERILRAAGQWEQTKVIVTGDHGELFYEHDRVLHGGPLFEESIRVPLVISNLNPEFRSRSLDSPVSHIDIAPTILSLAGLPPADSFQGESLLALDAPGSSRPVFVSVQAVSDQDAVIDGDWKLLRDNESGEERLFRLPDEERDRLAEEPSRGACLASALKEFRNSQLSYFQDPHARRRCRAPKYPALACDQP